MFELVNNIEDYPRFLPWCHSAVIDQHSEKEMIATLVINWKGMHKNFTTQNALYPHERIEIALVNGPLQHLSGIWNFFSIGEHACKITLDLEFEFAGRLVDKLFQPIFQHIANTFVDAFCKRADELYAHE